jgi:hypothetical protein
LFLLALAQAVSAPATPGSLIGSVMADGVPVRHARVVAQAPSGPAIATSTDGRGDFRFDRLAPGPYTVRAEKPGFVRPTTLDAPVNQTTYAAQVQANGVVTVPIRLARAAEITGTIDVSRGRASDQTVIYVTVDRLFLDRNDVPQTEPFTGEADDARRFRIANLPAGRYRVRTFLPDVSYWYAPGTTSVDHADVFTLASGQSVDIGDLRLRRESADAATPPPQPSPARVIHGRILDEFGDPAPWVRVELLQSSVIAGHRYLQPLGVLGRTASFPVAKETDDRGRFRFEAVPTGDIYLVALPGPFKRQAQTFAEAEGLSGLRPSFYPGTERAADARPIRIDNGTVASDITLTLTPSVTGSLNLRYVDDQGRPYLRQVNMGVAMMTLNTLFLVQDGRLQPAVRTSLSPTVRNLPVGDYMAWHDNELIPVTIAPGDLNEITIQDSPAPVSWRTSGMLMFDGPSPPLDRNRVEFQPADPGLMLVMGGGATPLAAQVAPDGRFTFPSWTRGLGVVRVAAPEGWALARVTTGGREISDAATDLAGLDNLRVEITHRVGSVVGRVSGGERPSTTHGVVIYAEAANLRTFPSRFIHVAHVDALGHFKVPNVLPGRYLALALLDNTTTDVDLDWLEEMRAAAAPVIVSEGTEASLVVQARR